MACSGGRPQHEVAPPPLNPPTTSYAAILNPKPPQTATTQPSLTYMNPTSDPNNVPVTSVAIKEPTLKNGKHTISWHRKEIIYSIYRTKLQWAIQGKFKYGAPAMEDLRKIIPLQCGLKGDCSIGLLEPRQVLIRCTLKEDYVKLLSKSGFWLTIKNVSTHMRTLKWDPWNDTKKETPVSVAWISFPNLPPNLFAPEFLYSLALAVGKPLNLDVATENGTRPSCAKVKVEVNLLKDLPQEIQVGEHDDDGNMTDSKWIKIRYDYLPKYCKNCSMQGHNEENCYVIHPELYPKSGNGEAQEQIPSNRVVQRQLSSGLVVTESRPTQEWQNGTRKSNKGPRTDLDNGSQKQEQHVLHQLHCDKVKDKEKINRQEHSLKNKFSVLDDEEERDQRQGLDATKKACMNHVQMEEGEIQLPVASEKTCNSNKRNTKSLMGTTGKKELINVMGKNGGDNSTVEAPQSQQVPPHGFYSGVQRRLVLAKGNESTKDWVNKTFYNVGQQSMIMEISDNGDNGNLLSNKERPNISRAHKIDSADKNTCETAIATIPRGSKASTDNGDHVGQCTTFLKASHVPTPLLLTVDGVSHGHFEELEDRGGGQQSGTRICMVQREMGFVQPGHQLQNKVESHKHFVKDGSTNANVAAIEIRSAATVLAEKTGCPVHRLAEASRKANSQFEDDPTYEKEVEDNKEGEDEGEDEEYGDEDEEEEEDCEGDEDEEEEDDEEEEGEGEDKDQEEVEAEEEDGEYITHNIEAPPSNIQSKNIPLLEPIRIQPPQTTRSIYKVVSRK